MTDLAALTARAETLTPALEDARDRWLRWREHAQECGLMGDAAALLRDLLTYATTVGQELDDTVSNGNHFLHRAIKAEAALAAAIQERDAAIASARAAVRAFHKGMP